MKKRIIAVVLALALSLASIPFAGASSSEFKRSSKLDEIAASTITLSYTELGNGAVQVIYKNIDRFVALAQQVDYIDDQSIAQFIWEYTGQVYDKTAPDDVVLQALSFQEVSTNTQLFQVQDSQLAPLDFAAPYADWISSDGWLQLSTTANKQTVNGRTCFLLLGTAKWLSCPTVADQDILVLTSTAALDDSFNDFGSFEESYYCQTHDNQFSRLVSVSAKAPYDDGLSMEYRSGCPGIRFNIYGSSMCVKVPYATAHEMPPEKTFVTATLMYRVFAPADGSVTQAQLTYCHTGIGFEVNWSVGVDGLTPSFSGVTAKYPYYARPISLVP